MLTYLSATQDAFGTVIVIVVVVGALLAIITFAGSRSAYEQIGKGGLFTDDDVPKAKPPTTAEAAAEREDELRQLLEARNYHLAKRGKPTVDIEAEMERLKPRREIDPALEDEIRSLVIARNLRRERRGEDPLDVEDEVRRQIEELSG